MENTVLTIFGATGDLAKKKIYPALAELHKNGKLPTEFSIIGFSRRPYSDEEFRDYLRHEVFKNNSESVQEFLKINTFVSGTFDNTEAYKVLKEKLEMNNCNNLLLYLSIQQDFYTTVIENLGNLGLNNNELTIKLLVEKPLGKSKTESIELHKVLTKHFSDEQIYLIDHYLHKKVAKNIFAFRFFNSIFEAGWSNQSIEKIEIITNEDFGVEDRGAFYDELGTLKDVGQNHLLELLALVTMEKIDNYSPKNFAKKRAEAIKRLEKITDQNVNKRVYKAQHKGFKQIEEVSPDSATETFFRLKTYIDSPIWRGVPIIIQAGKRLPLEDKKVVVTFKEKHKKDMKMYDVVDVPNTITFRLPPKEEIDLSFDLISDDVQNGLSCTIKEAQSRKQYTEEYKNVVLDAIEGNKTWFVTIEEVIASWEFVDSVVSAWNKPNVILHEYEPNSPAVLQKSIKEIPIHYSNNKRELGLIGLGKMGGGIARNLMEHGWDVIANNRSREKVDQFVSEGGIGAYSIQELVQKLERPRKVWVMVPSGDAIEQTLLGDQGLINYLEEGDIVIDAGNSNYKESIRRAQAFQIKGINFVDAGVSGGPYGARYGACIMIGGKEDIFNQAEDIFKDTSLPGGYMFFPGNGAGHFVKMVHNGIEYGMMQAIGEGFEVMKAIEYKLDLTKVAEVYNRGSVIESRLVDWLLKAYTEYGQDLSEYSGKVGHLGEGKWTVEAGKKLGVPTKVIEDAFNFRVESFNNPTYTGKVVSALREQFGGKRKVK